MIDIYQQRGFITWCRLCRVVMSDPEQVLDQAKKALRFVAPVLRPRILALAATALRKTARLDEAERLYAKARLEAEKVGDLWAVADIVHRSARVATDRGEPEVALVRTREAISHYERLGDGIGVGRALVSEGQHLYHLEDFGNAELAFRRALKLLPAAETTYRISALGNLATLATREDRLDLALFWMRAATDGHRSAPTGFLADCLQTRGALSFRIGLLAEAEACFRRCRELYKAKNRALDCAFVTVCLCEVLLAKGEVNEVVALVKDSTHLIGHLRENRAPAGIIATLANYALAGHEITAEMLEVYRVKLEEVRAGRP